MVNPMQGKTVPFRKSRSLVRPESLSRGRLIDLEGDPYADPGDSAELSAHPEFAFEYEVVAGIERETDNCIRIDFESGFSCGFPPDHLMIVCD